MDKYIETNKGSIRVKKYSFGWAVAVRGHAYEGVGSFRKLADLVIAINNA